MLSYLVSVSRRKSVCFDRSLSIVLAFCCIRVPKIVPLLELFSSKGGTFQFQRRNFLVPRRELFFSYLGNLSFQRWKCPLLLEIGLDAATSQCKSAARASRSEQS